MVKVKCTYCDTEFERQPSHAKGKELFCNNECRTAYRNRDKTEQECLQCGQTFEVNASRIKDGRGKLCSKVCMTKYLSGENHHAWKGGVGTFVTMVRNMRQYETWRTNVIERDDYVCQHCGEINNLDVHHLVELNKLIRKYEIKTTEQAENCKELWNIRNGLTLCIHCHAEEHPDLRDLFKLRIV